MSENHFSSNKNEQKLKLTKFKENKSIENSEKAFTTSSRVTGFVLFLVLGNKIQFLLDTKKKKSFA